LLEIPNKSVAYLCSTVSLLAAYVTTIKYTRPRLDLHKIYNNYYCGTNYLTGFLVIS